MKKLPLCTISSFFVAALDDERRRRATMFLDMCVAVNSTKPDKIQSYLNQILGKPLRAETEAQELDPDEISRNIREFKKAFAMLNRGAIR